MRTLVLAKTIVWNDEHELLTLRRSDRVLHRPGGFDLPGGKLDPGETVLMAAMRELAEESGLRPEPEAMHLVFADSHVGHRGGDPEELNIVWLGYLTKVSGQPPIALSDEHKQYAWKPIDEALAECDSPTQRRFLTNLKERNILQGSGA